MDSRILPLAATVLLLVYVVVVFFGLLAFTRMILPSAELSAGKRSLMRWIGLRFLEPLLATGALILSSGSWMLATSISLGLLLPAFWLTGSSSEIQTIWRDLQLTAIWRIASGALLLLGLNQRWGSEITTWGFIVVLAILVWSFFILTRHALGLKYGD
jgi:hypothetical protein